jgi:hypothetical protein
MCSLSKVMPLGDPYRENSAARRHGALLLRSRFLTNGRLEEMPASGVGLPQKRGNRPPQNRLIPHVPGWIYLLFRRPRLFWQF